MEGKQKIERFMVFIKIVLLFVQFCLLFTFFYIKKPGSLRYESLLSSRIYLDTIKAQRCIVTFRTSKRDFSMKYFLKTGIELYKEKFEKTMDLSLPYAAIFQKRFLRTSNVNTFPEILKNFLEQDIKGKSPSFS